MRESWRDQIGFMEGDIVRLKSGGPEMTVISIVDASSIYCSWFNRSDLSSASFTPQSLAKVEAK